MIDEPWKLEEIEPSEKVDRRVQRRLRAFAADRAPEKRKAPHTTSSEPLRGAVPFFPFERAVYVILVTVYAIYTGARAVRVFQETRASTTLPGIASLVIGTDVGHSEGARCTTAPAWAPGGRPA
jgi:hypothetical protein